MYASPLLAGVPSPDTIHTVAFCIEAVAAPEEETTNEAEVPVSTVPNDNGIFPVPSGLTPLTVRTFAVTTIPLTEIPCPAIICTKLAVVAFIALVAFDAVPNKDPVTPC